MSSSHGRSGGESVGVAGPRLSALLDSSAALDILGVKPQTLYAYVSRGLIRKAPGSNARNRLYYREDVEALRMKGLRRNAARPVGESVLRWGGAAVLPTAITALNPQGPVYRGHLALNLARTGRSFEQCAELLWTGQLPQQPTTWQPMPLPGSLLFMCQAIARIAAHSSSRQLLSLTTEAFAATAGREGEHSLGTPIMAARQLIRNLASVFGLLRSSPRFLPSRTDAPVAAIIARSGGIPCSKETLLILNACLVLAADHELTPATFVVRIAASAGANVFACVGSGISAFEALLTSSGCDACEATLRSARSPREYVDTLKRSSAMLDGVPGYNHAAYPRGDPRAELLLDLAYQLRGSSAAVRSIRSCIEAAKSELGVAPSIILGLVAVCMALKMPRESAGALMTIGRSAGWVAHALEHRLAGFMVCPRAKYVGVPYPISLQD